MRCFQYDEQTVDMDSCTGSTRWRKHKCPGNDTVLLWKGRSPDCQFKLTAGPIPTYLNDLFIIENAKSNVERPLAFVETLAIGSICWSTGIVNVMKRHPPLMQPLREISDLLTHHFGFGTTYIISFCALHWAVYIFPPMLQPDSTWWYVSNVIDFNVCNLLYVQSIQFNIWGNRCREI